MAYTFKLPDLGEGVAEGRVVEWLVSAGQEIREDDPLVEIETDKAVVVIPSPYAGTVTSLGCEEGDVVTVGSVLVIFDGSAGMSPAAAVAGVHVADKQTDVAAAAPRPAPVRVTRERVAALPGTRLAARTLGVDLEAVLGTGAGGRVTIEDVAAVAGGGSLHITSGGREDRRSCSCTVSVRARAFGSHCLTTSARTGPGDGALRISGATDDPRAPDATRSDSRPRMSPGPVRSGRTRSWWATRSGRQSPFCWRPAGSGRRRQP